jgi:hypothetical protein
VLTQTIWCVGILLEIVVAVRAVRNKLFSTYPLFYAFFLSVFASDIFRNIAYSIAPVNYASVFWATDFVSLLLGCGIVLEILRHALSPYRGAQRFARTLGLIVFGAVLCVGFGYTLIFRAGSEIKATYFVLERDFLGVQAIFIFAALAVVLYYGIPLGRNLKGIALGYGFCIAGSLVSFALRSQIGIGFDTWMLVEPLSYDVSLFIWAVALWSCHPNPVPDRQVRIEADYELLVSRTRQALATTRSYLGRATRL